MSQTRQSNRAWKRPVLLSTVAEHARVSTATVSRYLSDPTLVKEDRRERVATAIAELGYIPDGRARSLASSRSTIMGAIVPTLQNDRFVSPLYFFQRKLQEMGVTLLLGSSGYDAETEYRQVMAMVSQGVGALMLVGSKRPERTYELLRNHNVAYANAWSTDFASEHPSFGVDYVDVYKTLFQRFAEHGRRRIGALVASPDNNDRSAFRIEAIRQAAAATGMILSDDNLVGCGNAVADARAGAAHLLRNGPLDAIVCGTDLFAIATIIEARARNVDVPADMLVIGSADSDLSQHLSPTISTIAMPDRQLIEGVASYLSHSANGFSAETRKVYRASIVWRESTGDLQ